MNNTQKEVFDFKYLGPKDDINSIEVYEEALDYALSNSKIKNIAVTGSYGAGKSSIIEHISIKGIIKKDSYIYH